MSEEKFQRRKNDGKRRVATLVPIGAVEAISHAAEIGLTKYWLDGYRDSGGYSLSQCLDSAARHIMFRTSGEKYDPDGSVYLGHPVDHLNCAIWNLSTACENLRLYGDRNDDLWKGPGTAKTEISTEAAEKIMLEKLLDGVRKLIPTYKTEEDRKRAEDFAATLSAQIEEKK